MSPHPRRDRAKTPRENDKTECTICQSLPGKADARQYLNSTSRISHRARNESVWIDRGLPRPMIDSSAYSLNKHAVAPHPFHQWWFDLEYKYLLAHASMPISSFLPCQTFDKRPNVCVRSLVLLIQKVMTAPKQNSSQGGTVDTERFSSAHKGGKSASMTCTAREVTKTAPSEMIPSAGSRHI